MQCIIVRTGRDAWLGVICTLHHSECVAVCSDRMASAVWDLRILRKLYQDLDLDLDLDLHRDLTRDRDRDRDLTRDRDPTSTAAADMGMDLDDLDADMGMDLLTAYADADKIAIASPSDASLPLEHPDWAEPPEAEPTDTFPLTNRFPPLPRVHLVHEWCDEYDGIRVLPRVVFGDVRGTPACMRMGTVAPDATWSELPRPDNGTWLTRNFGVLYTRLQGMSLLSNDCLEQLRANKVPMVEHRSASALHVTVSVSLFLAGNEIASETRFRVCPAASCEAIMQGYDMLMGVMELVRLCFCVRVRDFGGAIGKCLVVLTACPVHSSPMNAYGYTEFVVPTRYVGSGPSPCGGNELCPAGAILCGHMGYLTVADHATGETRRPSCDPHNIWRAIQSPSVVGPPSASVIGLVGRPWSF